MVGLCVSFCCWKYLVDAEVLIRSDQLIDQLSRFRASGINYYDSAPEPYIATTSAFFFFSNIGYRDGDFHEHGAN